MPLPSVIFVTDPICSWCWATLPEVLKARQALSKSFSFELMMAGLQVGNHRPLTEFEVTRLQKLWREITETTGQQFSGRIPEDFIYHSEFACRAVEVVKRETGDAWDFFYQLQAAFYLKAANPSDVGVLQSLAPFVADFETKLHQQTIIDATLAQFDESDRLAAHALPSILLDTGEGPRLVCGGYVTADYLIETLPERMDASTDHPGD